MSAKSDAQEWAKIVSDLASERELALVLGCWPALATVVRPEVALGKNENSLVSEELSHGNCWRLVVSLTTTRMRLSACSIGNPGSWPIFMSAAV